MLVIMTAYSGLLFETYHAFILANIFHFRGQTILAYLEICYKTPNKLYFDIYQMN